MDAGREGEPERPGDGTVRVLVDRGVGEDDARQLPPIAVRVAEADDAAPVVPHGDDAPARRATGR